MKPGYAILTASLVLLCTTGSFARSFPFFPSAGRISISGDLTRTCVPHNGGTIYLEIRLTSSGPTDVRAVCRPRNIAVVLDRSGSMADERKMAYATRAVIALIDHLSSQDYLSVVAYDDRIETIIPRQRVTEKDALIHLVKALYPRGSTNLGGGLSEGYRQTENNFRPEFVNRVILLSDGLANRGITDPFQLFGMASRFRSECISLSTIGVGCDYNENLMLGLAEHGGGNYYFVESPRQIEGIFDHELAGIGSIAAQDARLELRLGRGVVLRDVIGYDRTGGGDEWSIPIGDLYTTDQREFTIELEIPEGAGTLRAVSGTLLYSGVESAPTFSADIRYTDDLSELSKGKNAEMQARADIALSTRSVERAMESLDAGRPDEAAKTISEAREVLTTSQATSGSLSCAPAVKQQLLRLESYSRAIQDSSGDARKLKKSIHYDNYRTQKSRNE